VASLFEHIDQGSTIDEFLEWFPSVRREQVHEVLGFAKSSLEQPAAVDRGLAGLRPYLVERRIWRGYF
jgi:uncharacterized protein (DUF433 family)